MKSIRRNHPTEKTEIKKILSKQQDLPLALTLTRPSQTSNEVRFLLCEATSFFMLWHELENVTNIIIN